MAIGKGYEVTIEGAIAEQPTPPLWPEAASFDLRDAIIREAKPPPTGN